MTDPRASAIFGRDMECAVLDRLIADAAEGRSGGRIVRGPAGIGKSALLDYAAEQASAAEIAVLRTAGVETGARLPYAALHQLLRPALGHLDTLPGPQAAHLRAAMGQGGSQGADWFLIGVATLSLLTEHADGGPVLCLVDDAQWLDAGSAAALLFAARRLDAEGIVMLFTARDAPAGPTDQGQDFNAPGVAELRLGGLDGAAAAALLAETAPGLAVQVRQRILEESGGNPLALREFAAALTSGQRAGALSPASFHSSTQPVSSRVRVFYAQRIRALPDATRLLLAVAAAEDTGETSAILRAGQALGAALDDLVPAEKAGFVCVSETRLAFRHPLIRSTAYSDASPARRTAIHRALAGVLDSEEFADRRAWHLAAAAAGPDEPIAAELEQAADRAHTRSGYAAAAAAYARAAELTPTAEAGARVRRLTAGAHAASNSGQQALATALAEQVAHHTADPADLAPAAQVRAVADFRQGRAHSAVAILTSAAAAIARDDPLGAAKLLTTAAFAIEFSIDLAVYSDIADRLVALELPEDCEAALVARGTSGLRHLYAGEYRAGWAVLGEVGAALRQRDLSAMSPENQAAAIHVLAAVESDTTMLAVYEPALAALRATGAVGALSACQLGYAFYCFWQGSIQDAAALAEEGLELAEDTGNRTSAAILAAWLAVPAALEGDEEGCLTRTAYAADQPSKHRYQRFFTVEALSLLDLGLGRDGAAMERLEEFHRRERFMWPILLPLQIEAAVRAGCPGRAEEPSARFAEWAAGTRHTWDKAAVLRCRALLAPGSEAELLYAEAVELHRRPGGRPFERARTELLYGEWLHRHRRSGDARAQLRSAQRIFERLGAAPWAERAAAQLRAAGESSTRGGNSGRLAALTPKELQVVRLAAAGLSNRDIGAQLFLSPRTVGYHMYKAFPKLGVASRAQLTRVDLEGPPARG